MSFSRTSQAAYPPKAADPEGHPNGQQLLNSFHYEAGRSETVPFPGPPLAITVLFPHIYLIEVKDSVIFRFSLYTPIPVSKSARLVMASVKNLLFFILVEFFVEEYFQRIVCCYNWEKNNHRQLHHVQRNRNRKHSGVEYIFFV